ncbi:MAG TPA: helix-turn-helix transcriptional regulator [Ktedonosporobacter sp.]|jgi:tetratricopeptide (TPR) repeat protein|nr:helix-turn-helix transcriptional regulator [Ktedonosporobacter sp.]
MYHYGLTIREYREKAKMTQQQLADKWPRSERFGGGEGVNWKYIQDIEHGRKRIEDSQTLRKVCDILHIPYWKVDLSEFDPFAQTLLPGYGKAMYETTLDTVEELIRHIWSLRCAARIVEADKGVKKLGQLFAYFNEALPPPVRLEKRYCFLYVQYLRLKATAFLEKKQYKETIQTYQEIFHLVKNEAEPSLKALALKSIGKELNREGKHQDAVDYLEEARDAAIDGSRLLRAFVHSYLIRAYGGNKDLVRFERAVNTGLTLAQSTGDYEDGTDFIYSWSAVSAIMAEQSWGYIELGMPEKTLAMREEITEALRVGQDVRVEAWIPLDWAKAYKLMGEIEQCITELREFYRRCTIMGSSHALSQVQKVLHALDDEGYGDIQAVREFKEELAEKFV